MKFYTITVNGNTYQVSVEENNGSFVNTAPVTPVAPVAQAAPVAAPTPQAAPAPQAAAPAPQAPTSNKVGSEKVNSPMPGKIVNVKATVGKAVKRGEVLLILEAMKMENEIVAPQDGTIVSVNVAVGQSVEAGDVLVTFE